MNGPSSKRLVIVGMGGPTDVGRHLLVAARAMGIETTSIDFEAAFEGPWWQTKANWWMRGHRPTHLRRFTERVVDACREVEPTWVIATGLAPLADSGLESMGHLGVRRLNYLTDDPWNPTRRSPWFMKALPLYDHVFTPRRANLEDLTRAGCRQVSHLPFAYAPDVHFPDPPGSPEEQARFDADVVFVGGADRDRVPYLSALIEEGFDVALYGGYWRRFRATKSSDRGFADASTVRKAIGGARTALCLVRRANRDGASMRPFEVPAMGGCVLAEDTEEHRELFGDDGEVAVFHRDIPDMIDKVRWLLDRPEERDRLRRAARERVVGGPHTYSDRLATMLSAPT